MTQEPNFERMHHELLMEFRRLRGEIEHLKELINHPIHYRMTTETAPEMTMHDHRGFRTMNEGIVPETWRLTEEHMVYARNYILGIDGEEGPKEKPKKKEPGWDL